MEPKVDADTTVKNETSEVRNLKAISPDDPLVKNALEALVATHLPMNFSRMNTGPGRSISLGRVADRYHHLMGESMNDAKYPELKKAVFALGKKIAPFKFSTVQVNHNYRTPTHIDKNNVGESVIIGLGNYKGGDLIVEGKRYNIKYRPVMFDGSKMRHSTSAYSGDRYSLVFFKTKDMFPGEK